MSDVSKEKIQSYLQTWRDKNNRTLLPLKMVFIMKSNGFIKLLILTATFSTIQAYAGNIIAVENPGTNNDIQPNILNAYSKAKDGDIITLPAGTFSYSKSIEFKKLVSLKGAGKESTVLFRPETISDSSLMSNVFFKWKIDRDSSCHIIIAGFTLKSKKPAGRDNLNGSLASDFGIIIINAVDFVITDCRFENFGYSAIMVQHKDDLARGLIYNNLFYHNFKGNGLGLGYGIVIYGGNLQWVNSPKFGTDNFIFIEDNTFEYHRHAIAGGGCGLYVCRHNTIKNNILPAAAVDMHEARGASPNRYSTRATEIYSNEITNDVYIDDVPITNSQSHRAAGTGSNVNSLAYSGIGIRGGESLIYNNYVAYCKVAIVLYAFYNPKTGDQNVYPLSTQIGYKSAVMFGAYDKGSDLLHGDGDVYMWNNSIEPYGPSSNPYNMLFSNADTTLLKEHRDYHFEVKPGYTPYVYPHPLRTE